MAAHTVARIYEPYTQQKTAHGHFQTKLGIDQSGRLKSALTSCTQVRQISFNKIDMFKIDMTVCFFFTEVLCFT